MAGDLLGELYEVVAFLHGGGVGVSGLAAWDSEPDWK